MGTVSHGTRGSQDGEGVRVTPWDKKDKEKSLNDKPSPPISPINFILTCSHLTQVLWCGMCVERGAEYGR